MRAVPLTTACFALLTAPASGQVCEPGWQPGFGWDPPAEASHAILTAAPLGREIIFVGGEFTRSVLGEPLSRVASFDGDRWDGLHGGVDGTVRALVAWDPDGAGSQSELVVAAGDFTRAGLAAPGGPVTAVGVAAWNGAGWRPLGGGVPERGRALAAVDVDGDGATDLFGAAGQRVLQFADGVWREIGLWPVGHEVRHLFAWDRDGTGAQPARLVGASFGTLRVWDGAQWEQLPTPPAQVSAVAAFDRDRQGPLEPSLFAAAGFPGWAQLYAFEGGVWIEMSRGTLSAPPLILAPLDPDGSGPATEGLYYGDHFDGIHDITSTLERYPELTWLPYTWTFHTFEFDVINDIALWRRGGDRSSEFWLARQTPDLPWQPGSVSAVSDAPDRFGLGLGPFVTFEHGVVSLADVPGHRLVGRGSGSLARYDGDVWRRWASADDGGIGDLITEDEQRLYVGGWFRSFSGIPMRGVGVYDEGAWRQLGDGLGSVYALALADLGKGRRLYAAGGRITSLDEPGVAEWDGDGWTTLGVMDGFPNDMTTHDPDGPGPAPDELVVGGRFNAIGGVPVSNVAAFDGASWRPLGVEFETVAELVSHDADAAGPLIATIYALDADNRISRFADGAWQLIGGPDDAFDHLISFDPDGEGPREPLLLAAGWRRGTTQPRLARLENDAWVDTAEFTTWCEGAFACTTPSLSAVMLAREGATTPALLMTGGFLAVEGQPSAGIALWIGACPCAADCDGDGELRFLDFLCFQNLFAAMDPGADCDGDSAFTFFDFLCFQNAFAAGCP